ncbi:MAG: hypothetical protein ABEI52_00605, partial [Halobacteriaceae archaeon]
MQQRRLRQIRERLEECRQPIFFFDDDCDGLASYLQVRKFVGDGKAVPVKDSPGLEEAYLEKVEEYQPDLVVVLDKPYITEEFLDGVGQEVLWIDHHAPQKPDGDVIYCNPRLDDDADNRPTSYWLYRALEQQLWIAMVGTVGDWYYPDDLADEFRQLYPGLLPEDVRSPEAAIHDTRLGMLVRVFNFNLNGRIRDTLASVERLLEIDAPAEILKQTSDAGSYVYEKYAELAEEYALLK